MTGAASEPARDVPALRRAIAESVTRLLVNAPGPGPELAALSPRVRIDGVDVFDGDIRISGDRFEGLVNVHCILGYDGGGADDFETAETFPGRFEGTVRADGPTVTRLCVDTTSFYS